jgi:hypothetical protein
METQRALAEQLRLSSERSREAAERERQRSEMRRTHAEAARSTSEDLRRLGEGNRKQLASLRRVSERERVTHEPGAPSPLTEAAIRRLVREELDVALQRARGWEEEPGRSAVPSADDTPDR